MLVHHTLISLSLRSQEQYWLQLLCCITDLQYARELGVSVRNVPPAFVVCECTDDIAKRQQTLVDVDSLCQVVASRSCVLSPLTACSSEHALHLAPACSLGGLYTSY